MSDPGADLSPAGGNGTSAEAPRCPKCSAEMIPEWDENPDGSWRGTGVWLCPNGDDEDDGNGAVTRPRLTAPQRALLAEIAEAGTLYIREYGQYGRTVEALERKGYVVRSEPDYSGLAQHGYTVAPDHLGRSPQGGSE